MLGMEYNMIKQICETHVILFFYKDSNVVVIRVLCGRYFGEWRCIRGLRYRSPTAKSRRHSASGVTSFGRPFRQKHYVVVVAMTCEACEAETQARFIARGKRSATPGIHHPHQPCIRIGCELHIILGLNRGGVVFLWAYSIHPYNMRRSVMHTRHPTILTAERLQLQ